MIFEIKTLTNGLILECKDEEGSLCFQELYNEDQSLTCFCEFLTQIIETYSPLPDSRYSDKRIKVRIYHGDKSEAYESFCNERKSFLKSILDKTLSSHVYHTDELAEEIINGLLYKNFIEQ